MTPTSQQLALFEKGQPLVHSIALGVMRRLPMHVELDDLIAYGQLGLAEAVVRFDEQHNTRFTTFAYYRIKGAIFDGVSKMSWTIRGRTKSRSSQAAGAPPDRSAATAQSAESTYHLARVFINSNCDPDTCSSSVATDENLANSPLVDAMNREIAVKLHKVVKALPRLSRMLIEAIYYDGATLQEAAVRTGISKSWASRVHAQTLQKLALILREMGMD